MLLCNMLKADLKAKKAKRIVQAKQLWKYCCIISQLMNGDKNVVVEIAKDEGPYHPQTPIVNLKTSSNSTSPAVCHHQLHLV